MNDLHPRQIKLLQLLKDHIDSPLMMTELSEEAEIYSPGVLYHHLRQLERKGYLKRNPDNPKDYNIDIPFIVRNKIEKENTVKVKVEWRQKF